LSEFRILAQLKSPPREMRSGQVLARFCLRMTILTAFAAFGDVGFGRSLTALLWMAIVFSAVVGIMKRERPFGAVLNHWDETVAYTAIFSLVSSLNHAVPT
jgi:hypothetical protein